MNHVDNRQEAETHPLRDFYDLLRSEMLHIEAGAINDGDKGEAAWNHILNAFVELLVFHEKHSSHINPTYIFSCASYMKDGREATPEDKQQFCEQVIRAAFFRMLELYSDAPTMSQFQRLLQDLLEKQETSLREKFSAKIQNISLN